MSGDNSASRGLTMRLLILSLALAGVAIASDLPPHFVAVGGGWYECERGYVMRNGRECISEVVAAAEERFVVSALPSAGDGSRQRSATRTIIVERDTYRSPYSRYGGPFPDGVYDSLQRGTSGRVVPFTSPW